MVFLEQPAGVGFSFTTDPTILGDFNDMRASLDNVKTIRAFYKKFPRMADKPFYLASESYGGHYIPHWTYQILNDPNNEDIRAKFKGYLVGNPYTSFASGSIAMANVMWGLQLIPATAWKQFSSKTCDVLSHDPYFLSTYLPECFAYLDAIFEYTASLNPCKSALDLSKIELCECFILIQMLWNFLFVLRMFFSLLKIQTMNEISIQSKSL
jgi:serine carboxypeptidase-like clade 2